MIRKTTICLLGVLVASIGLATWSFLQLDAIARAVEEAKYRAANPVSINPFAGQTYTCNTLVDKQSVRHPTLSRKMELIVQNYDKLEAGLNCLVQAGLRLDTGESGTQVVSQFYREIFKRISFEEKQKLADDWVRSQPESEFAQFAQLRLSYEKAWFYRGHKYASETGPEKLENFHAQLETAREKVSDPGSALHGSAISTQLLFGITLDIEGISENSIEIYEEAVAQWPHHHTFHRLLIHKMVPRWGGSWELVEKAIASISDDYEHEYGNILYARMYYQLHDHFNTNPTDTHVSWTRLKQGLEEWEQRHPGDKIEAIQAGYACAYDDFRLYQAHRPTSEKKYWEMGRGVWVKGTDWETCETKLKEAAI